MGEGEPCGKRRVVERCPGRDGLTGHVHAVPVDLL